MLMKWFLSFMVVFSCLHINIPDAFCSESYYINNNRVLLYKIINWWNDCIPEESSHLCWRRIKCENEGDAHIVYSETEKTLKLQIKGGFAELLSTFKQCDQCFGPSYLQCTWLNKKYFGYGEAVIVQDELPAISALFFNNINKKEWRLIRSVEKDIELVLEGVIGGLLMMNGKIALHQAGNFLKTCPKPNQNRDNSFPISLKIINSRTEEVLAKYTAIWNQ